MRKVALMYTSLPIGHKVRKFADLLFLSDYKKVGLSDCNTCIAELNVFLETLDGRSYSSNGRARVRAARTVGSPKAIVPPIHVAQHQWMISNG